MLDFLDNIGVYERTPEIQALFDEAIGITKGLESMTPEAFDKHLEKLVSGMEAWFTEDFENLFTADVSEQNLAAGLESAYVNDRSIFKNAFIRFKMFFKLDGEKAAVEYIDVLRQVDPSVIDRGYKDLIMPKESVLAFDTLMKLSSEVSGSIDRKEIELLLSKLGDKLYFVLVKLILALLASPVPVLGLLALGYLIYLNYALVTESEDLNQAYGEDLKRIVTKMLSKTSLVKSLGVKPSSDGSYDVSALMKITSAVNKLKATMIPMTLRRRSGILPDFLKRKTSVSYEDRFEMATLIKNNAELYIRTMGSSPAKRMNAIRFILGADQFSQTEEYGAAVGLQSESAMYSGIAITFMTAFIDLITASMVLSRDLKNY